MKVEAESWTGHTQLGSERASALTTRIGIKLGLLAAPQKSRSSGQSPER